MTLLGVITIGVLPGVVVAVGAALVQLLARASHPHDALFERTGLDEQLGAGRIFPTVRDAVENLVDKQISTT